MKHNGMGRYMPNFAPHQWYMRIARWMAYCMPLAVLIVIVAPLITQTPGDEWNEENLKLASIQFMVAQSLLYVVFAVATIIEATRLPGGSAAASGLVPSIQTPRHLATGAIVALGILVVTAIAALTIGGNFTAAAAAANPVMMLGLVVSSMGEEVLFRGTVFRALEQRFGSSVTIVITSALFASVHLGNPHVEPLAIASTFFVGILLGSMVIRTASLWMAMSFHVVWNICSSAFFGVVSGLPPVISITKLDMSHVTVPDWIIGGAYGIESGAVVIVCTIAAIAIVPKYCNIDPFAKAARYRIEFAVATHNVVPQSSSVHQ